MSEVEPNTTDLAGVAERLRAVKTAQRRFLRLWGIEQAMINPLLDRMADDLEKADALPSADLAGGPGLTEFPEFPDHADGGWIGGDGWSMNG